MYEIKFYEWNSEWDISSTVGVFKSLKHSHKLPLVLIW